MRELALDTETTGLDALTGDRLVEIGCIELVNHIPTGKTYHQYINPERDMPSGAFAIHGLSEEFLRGFPVFADIADAFLEFINDDPLIIHNAKFDMGFINAELRLLNHPLLPMSRSIDTVALARRRFPGAPASLDALCRRFDIDNSSRIKHGALLDAELLAEVYLEFCGGRQPDLSLTQDKDENSSIDDAAAVKRLNPKKALRPPRPHTALPDELAAHDAFLAKLNDSMWLRKKQPVE
ncbi:MAG: DNA polymerase III subunit epsilon [Pseudomonadota bacterium]|nr:DNA polymerase III subunit epsilon [Pseudomonadota bacterium]MEC8087854.1 DNA polymerase III subunit epsilon [Pseudomonadota bacterium]MEC8288924.1 DNA polymerase III subunit epsilon [Pseudomonadota bacterium]MEC8463283.1 DNA polymerase III subunit epsilon [Pseudomonadota bacterium]